MCIPTDKVCNRKNDCGAWQDEPKHLCHINECATVGNEKGNLNEETFLSRKKSKFLQKEHGGKGDGQQQYITKGHITVVGGGCDQQCIDLPIGYKCACDKGYKLVGNTTCIGKLQSLFSY